MVKRNKSLNLDRWVRRHQGKHFCHCGCGSLIQIKREYHKPSVGIPKFIKGHNLQKTEEELHKIKEELHARENSWAKLSPDEKERRLSNLKSFGKGEDNPSWKGGRRVDERGYVQLLMPEHPFSRDGYVLEHRLVVENRTKEFDPDNPLLVTIDGEKYLRPSSVVHHIDEIKTNNESSNLMLLYNQKAHSFIHYSPLSMKERLHRLSKGICHSRRLSEAEETAEILYPWFLSYINK